MKKMNFKLSVEFETDWDTPNQVLTKYFSAKSWEEAKEIAEKSICYTEQNMEDALNEEFDYNWSIMPDLTPWTELAYRINEMAMYTDGYCDGPTVYATLELISESIEVDITKEYYRQNNILAEADKLRRAEEELAAAKAKIKKLRK